MSTTPELDALRLPLHGSALIEASAGTGKTFTLALLYLRLVLRHGGSAAFSHDLTPPEILVVTFTKAATQELRDRIRRRLVQAAALFRAELDDNKVDPQLRQLRDEVAKEENLQGAARRLDAAAEWMDEAAVSTIHAWCYQVLRSHAFSSGHAFEQTLLESEHELLQQVCVDYWRSFYQQLDRAAMAEILKSFANPTALSMRLWRLLGSVESLPESPEAEPATYIEELRKELEPSKSAAKDWVPVIRDLFDDAAAQNRLDRGHPRRNHREPILNAVLAWAESDDVFPKRKLEGTTFRRLALLETDNWKNAEDLPVDQSASQALAALARQLEALPDLFSEYLLVHSTHWVHDRLDAVKTQQALLSNNDLLTRLDQALSSERGEQLAASIRRQYPVALVDEFQDTDPVQYRIFNAIYRVANPHPDTGFFMIGDPKQAIYGFRGADIYTYLEARKDTTGRHYTLPWNFRSAPKLIGAVNGLFEVGEENSAGAFGFATTERGNPVPFFPVKSGNDDPNQLLVNGEPVPPQQVWLHTADKITKEAYQALMGTACADEITSLLTLARQGKALLNLDGDPRPLRPSDIAVLVYNKDEADCVRKALFERKVPSVYLSDDGSVYGTSIAAQLLQLLKAVVSPTNERQLRRALATDMLGWSLHQLEALNTDEWEWEAQVVRFQRYHQCWRQQGILALIRRLISDFEVAPKLLQQPRGERDLTDLLHLAELLQHSAGQLDGEQALLRFFEEAHANPEDHNEAQQQRLESDSELVQVVTVFKAKGLQYPLVFLPFACSSRRVKSSDRPLKWHDAEGKLKLGLTGTDSAVFDADIERKAEDVRKLYVALTRAMCCQWLGLATLPDLEKTAIGSLLNTSAEGLEGRVIELQSHLRRVALPAAAESYDGSEKPQWRKAREVSELKLTPWYISSYSSLRFGQLSRPVDAEPITPDTARDEQVSELMDEPIEVNSPAAPEAKGLLHQLPRGSEIGTFLHSLLEWAAVQKCQKPDGSWLLGFAAAAWSEPLRLEMLQARCHRRRLQDWIQPLSEWLQRFLTQRWLLDDLTTGKSTSVQFALSDLQPKQMSVEMEFLFEARGVNTVHLDNLVTRQTWQGAARPSVLPSYLQGMLKGFIDLVLEHDGRFYVVDWKSNYLGATDLDYSRDAMCSALLKKRYDLQYVVYLLALHRQLKARLPNYDYDQHIGGAIYVFLRGSEHPESQGLLMDKPPKALIEQLDRLFAAETATDKESYA